jgi:hypothetical protein
MKFLHLVDFLWSTNPLKLLFPSARKNMNGNLISLNECREIVGKLLPNEKDVEIEVIDYEVKSYCDGYPGFLGDYFSLKIQFNDVRYFPYIFQSLTGLNDYVIVNLQKNTLKFREESFFVKSLPVKNIEKRNILKDSGIFKKESGIFECLVPKLIKYSGNYLFSFMIVF